MHTDLQLKLNSLIHEASQIGLHLNISRIKSMRFSVENVNNFNIQLIKTEEVEEFWYLGSIVKDGGITADVDSRIRKAATFFGMFSDIWQS